MDLEIDVYISHFIDKNSYTQNYQTWVDNFREYISWFIKKLSKKDLNIISSSDLMKDETISLNDALKNAKCIILILSPEYSSSIQFQNELQLVINQKSINSDIKDKVFKVVKYPIDGDKIPPEIQESFSYDLFVMNTEKDEVVEFYEFIGEADENIFWFKIVDLCYDLYYQIINKEVPQVEAQKAVYLAEAGKDQSFHRDLIKRDFLMKGYDVLPKSHLQAKNLNELEQNIVEYISKCEFSIHIFGDEPGRIIENTELSIVDFQNQIAAKFSQQNKSNENSNPFYRFIWIPPNLKLYNQKQLSRIENLKRNIREIENAEIIETPLEVFRSIVRARIREEANSNEEKIRNITNTNCHCIYIIFEYFEKNKAEIGRIKELLQHEKISILEPDFGDDQRILINSHKRKLVEADSVFVYYNNTGSSWLKSKVQDVLKAPGYGKNKMFVNNSVFVFDDEEKIIENLQINDFNVYKINNGVELEHSINEYLEAVLA